jgi:cytochrome P450
MIPFMPKRNPLPPGPRNSWPGQQLLSFRRSPTNFLLRVAREYGDISRFRLGPHSLYFLNHPDYVKDVLVTRQDNFRKGLALQRAKFLFGEGLLTSEGEQHKRQRRLVQPAFHSQRVASYGKMMVRHAAETCAGWKDEREFDLAREMRRLTLLIVCEALFGADVEDESEKVDEAVTSVISRFQLFGPPWSVLSRTLRKLTPTAIRQRATTREKLDAIILRIIREQQQTGLDGDNLLTVLLSTKDQASGVRALSDTQVRDEVITLFMAGHETTANALTWAWSLLSQHPEVEAKFHDEVDAVLGERLPSVEDVPRLRYAEMIFAEAIRLYPPSWLLSRRAIENYEVGGYKVPAGSHVILSPYVMHHDERYYVTPFRFDPERWTESARGLRPEFSYFPFGGGRRRCIGESFAWLEGVLILTTLARAWRMTAVTTRPVELQPGMVLRAKHGMSMRPKQRKGHRKSC